MIEKILSPILRLFGLKTTPTNISWIQVLIYAFVPLGQLWARVFLLNGSLDKKWLFFPFLVFPPFSLLPMIMMKLGLVAKGKGLKPYDNMMFAPIVLHLLMTYLLGNMFEEESTYNLVYILLLFGATVGVLTYRISKNCEFKTSYIGKNIMDSTRIVAMAEFIPFIMGFIPIIGKIYTIITMIPFIGSIAKELLWGIGYVSAYTLNNMLNQDNMDRYCKTPLMGYKTDKIGAIIYTIAIIFIKFLNKF
jgi:hypothetical protein